MESFNNPLVTALTAFCNSLFTLSIAFWEFLTESFSSEGITQVFLAQCIRKEPLTPFQRELAPEVFGELPPLKQEKLRKEYEGKALSYEEIHETGDGFDVLDEILRVMRFDEIARRAAGDDFRRAVERIRDDGLACGHALHDAARQALTQGEMHKYVHQRDIAADFRRRDKPREDEILLQAHLGDLRFEFRAEDAVADDEKTDFRIGGDELRRGF